MSKSFYLFSALPYPHWIHILIALRILITLTSYKFKIPYMNVHLLQSSYIFYNNNDKY